jgi:hypothetical protein
MTLMTSNYDGSNEYTDVTLILMDYTSGIGIISNTPLSPIYSLIPASPSQAGGVAIGEQSWLGPKTLLGQSSSEPNWTVGGDSVLCGSITMFPTDTTADDAAWVSYGNISVTVGGTGGNGPGTLRLLAVNGAVMPQMGLNLYLYSGTDPTTDRPTLTFESGQGPPNITFLWSSVNVSGLQGTQGDYDFVAGVAVAYTPGGGSPIVLGTTPVTGGTAGSILSVGSSDEAEQIGIDGSLVLTPSTPPPSAGTLGLAALSGSGAPASGLGAPGSVYFDVSNTSSIKFYFKT